MMDPRLFTAAGANGKTLEIPTEARSDVGGLFTLALLRSTGCQCDACRFLHRIVDRMEATLAPPENASAGNG